MPLYIHNENPNAVVSFLRRAYNPVGFKKGYNAILWFICTGYLLGFTLARISYLNLWDQNSSSSFIRNCGPGEIYWIVTSAVYKHGIAIHLCAVIPGSLLALFQFVPAIRYKALLAHRVNGYLVYTLTIISAVGALMVARRAFGGDMAAQTFSGFLSVYTVIGSFFAYINVKRLQLDQHRAWMIRVWVLMATIVTLRIIQHIMMSILTLVGSYYYTILCGQLAVIASPGFMNSVSSVCAQGGELAYVSVNVDLGTLPGTIAAMEITFGMAGWIAIAFHVIGVELYLAMTPAESERLRQLSYERQLARGFSRPGTAGLTVDKWGDAEVWVPKTIKGNGDAAMLSSGSSSDLEDELVKKPQGVYTV
ncbi:hypothetical protein K431DRAFT_307870 [Polychaeton citri CBS 116435]|uniref:Uncharacterized protein n=1 Tax=Polychaeton citri CBS 116435 TaxID=1314669 RepID=A0A9P4PWR5_9PEZI|nr:hypothetical protein K431DRAFT_307870 [Polychaeton citri CBS 116435]